MGKVYLAQHQRIARHVAVKVLLPELSTNQEVIERFFTEAQATSLIKHPGIVEVLDCDVLEEQAFIVMEYLHGESLAGYWARLGGKMNDAPFALAVVGQVAEAVGAAHGVGIIHRDLKPDNVFLCAGARDARVTPKVLDFGIAKVAVQGSTSNTRTGVVIGTPAYMSPEQCRESKTVDGRADIYSLGCILYEALCGRPPFVREGAGAMIIAHVAETPDDPRSLAPDLPSGAVDLLGRMLAKDKEARPENMAAVTAEIRRVLDQMGVSTPFSGVSPQKPVLAPTVEIDARLQTPVPPSLRTPPVGSLPGLAPREAMTDRGLGPGQTAPGARVPMTTRSTLGSAAGERSEPDDVTLRPPTSSRRWLIPTAVVAVAGIAFAAKTLLSKPDAQAPASSAANTDKPAALTPPAPPAAPGPVANPPVPAPSAAPETVTVEVLNLPAGAEVSLDGVKAASVPLEIKRDERRHRLVVRANGQERTVEIGADRNQTVDLPVMARAKPEKHRASSAHEKPAPVKPAAVVTSSPRTNPPPAVKKSSENQGRRSNYDDM